MPKLVTDRSRKEKKVVGNGMRSTGNSPRSIKIT
jgi:hypothetical protein